MNNFLCGSITNRLKEKGFMFELPITYDGNGTYHHSVEPRISQVLDWLRKEKKLHIVCPLYKDKGFYYYVQRIGNASRIVSSFSDSDDCFDTYEQAALAGIRYVLDNLI